MGGGTSGDAGAAIETVMKIAGIVDILPKILGCFRL
jgi:ribosomal protein S5